MQLGEKYPGGRGKEVEEELFLLGRVVSKGVLLKMKMISCETYTTKLDNTLVASVGLSSVLNQVDILEMMP